MSESYLNAEAAHYECELKSFFSNITNGNPILRNQRQHRKPYSKMKHYIPHGIALGVLCLAGGYGLIAYNSAQKSAYESISFASW